MRPSFSLSLRARREGRDVIQMEDGTTSFLTFRFESYRSPGGERLSPFTPRVSMHSPQLQARFAPHAAEPRAFIALEESLDGSFTTTAFDAIAEVERTGGEP